MTRLALALALASLALPAQAASLEEQRRALQALTAQEDALAHKLGADRNALARLLGALELFSRDPPPPLLVSPTDARDAVRAMILARALTPELEARARTLALEAASLERLRRQTVQASGALFLAESEIQDRQGRLDAVTADAGLLSPPSMREAAAAEDALPMPTQLAPPTGGGRIVARFGGKLENGLVSQGVAWRTGPDAQVRSPAAAIVAYAGPLAGWGKVVILRAGGGCHMVLAGLGKVTVAAGQSVAVAFPVGSMPTDGQSPPELYLEVRTANGPIDPVRLMAGRGESVGATGLRLRREGVG